MAVSHTHWAAPSQPSNMISHHLVELAIEVRNLQVLRRNCLDGTMENRVNHRYQEAIRHAKLHEMGGLPGVITTFLLQKPCYMSSDWMVWSSWHCIKCLICQPCRSDWQQKHPQWSFGTQTLELTARWLTGDQPTVHLVTTGYGQNPPSKGSALATPPPLNWLVSCSSLNLVLSSRELLKDCTVWHGAQPRETLTLGDSWELAAGAGKLLPMASYWAGITCESPSSPASNAGNPFRILHITKMRKCWKWFTQKQRMWLRIW